MPTEEISPTEEMIWLTTAENWEKLPMTLGLADEAVGVAKSVIAMYDLVREKQRLTGLPFNDCLPGNSGAELAMVCGVVLSRFVLQMFQNHEGRDRE